MDTAQYQDYVRRVTEARNVVDVCRVVAEARSEHGAQDPLIVPIARTAAATVDLIHARRSLRGARYATR